MKLFWKTGNYPLKQAFTLLECLISLMIFSLVLHGLLTAVDYYKASDQRMRQNRQNDLHHFELLFEEELKHYQVVQVHDQRLILANPEKKLSTLTNHSSSPKNLSNSRPPTLSLSGQCLAVNSIK